MKKLGIYSILLFGALVFVGTYTLATNQDNSFWMEAAQGGMAEVRMGELALQKSQNDEVRRFAQMMVDDHTRSNQELMTLAQGKNITLPTDVSNRHREAMEKFNRLSGADFDREYMKTQVKEHERMIKLFERQSEKGGDADAKAFATKTLPNLQSHRQMARTISDSVKNTGRAGNGNQNTNRDSNSDTGNSNMNMNSNQNTNATRNTNSNSNRNTNRNTNVNSNINGL